MTTEQPRQVQADSGKFELRGANTWTPPYEVVVSRGTLRRMRDCARISRAALRVCVLALGFAQAACDRARPSESRQASTQGGEQREEEPARDEDERDPRDVVPPLPVAAP